MHATQGRGGRAGGMRAPCATVVLYARVPEADGWERASYETPRRLWPALARPIPLWATFRLPMTSLNPRLPDQRRARSQKGNLIGRWGGGPRPPPSGLQTPLFCSAALSPGAQPQSGVAVHAARDGLLPTRNLARIPASGLRGAAHRRCLRRRSPRNTSTPATPACAALAISLRLGAWRGILRSRWGCVIASIH